MKSYLTILLFIILIFNEIFAEKMVKVKLENWQIGKQDLIVGFNEINKIGVIKEDGTLMIPLPDNYLEKQRIMMKEINKKNEDGWKVSAKTLESMYSCRASDLDYSNPKLELAGFGKLGGYNVANIDQKQMHGVIFPSDSKEFADWELSMGQEDAAKGFTIDFVYAHEAATVKGECESSGFTKVTTTYYKTSKYDIDLEKGWNIVKYSVDELFEDKEGNLYPSVESYTIVEQIPDNIEWFFIDEK